MARAAITVRNMRSFSALQQGRPVQDDDHRRRGALLPAIREEKPGAVRSDGIDAAQIAELRRALQRRLEQKLFTADVHLRLGPDLGSDKASVRSKVEQFPPVGPPERHEPALQRDTPAL